MLKERTYGGEGARPPVVHTWEFRLFVAGLDPAAERVRSALSRLCELHLPGSYRIEVVDVLANPEQADAFDIVAVPTVIRERPLPARRIIGDLSATEAVLAGLGIAAQATD